ncbi:MAG: DUF975 family protein [Butyrivibrio sp.]|nr:DUF975 family protein [Butyrivibrio sp.]
MSSMKSSAELKAIAAEKSLGKYGTLIGANIIIFAIQVLATGFTTVATSGNIAVIIINNIITLIVNILLGLLMSGKAYLYMNLLYSQTVSTSDIFFGLRKEPQKAVIIQAVFVLVDFLVSIPSQILLVFYQQDQSSNLLSALLIALFLGLVVNILVSLTYSQAFFLLHDFPGRSAKELLATSRRLMRGNKLRLFILNISFVPLYLLGCISLFVPLLWISVYRYASICAFYQDLVASAASGNN